MLNANGQHSYLKQSKSPIKHRIRNVECGNREVACTIGSIELKIN